MCRHEPPPLQRTQVRAEPWPCQATEPWHCPSAGWGTVMGHVADCGHDRFQEPSRTSSRRHTAGGVFAASAERSGLTFLQGAPVPARAGKLLNARRGGSVVMAAVRAETSGTSARKLRRWLKRQAVGGAPGET